MERYSPDCRAGPGSFMTGQEKSRGSPAPLSLLDFSPSCKLRAAGGERGQDGWGQQQGTAVEVRTRGDRQVGHATT